MGAIFVCFDGRKTEMEYRRQRQRQTPQLMPFKRICFNLSQKVMSTYQWISFVINWHRHRALFTLMQTCRKKMKRSNMNTHTHTHKNWKLTKRKRKFPLNLIARWSTSLSFASNIVQSFSIAARNWFLEVTFWWRCQCRCQCWVCLYDLVKHRNW